MYIPFLHPTFPEPRPGPHATGYVVARVPIPPAEQHAGAPKLADGSPALHLTESVLAIYYPTNPAPITGAPWTPDTVPGNVRGYATYGQLQAGGWGAWLGERVLGRLRMPVHVGAEPASPSASASASAPAEAPLKFPVILFSHGLVGTRNTYSHFCSSLASEGYVVVAVEHSDGSAPCVLREGKEKVFTRLGDTDLWESDGSNPAKAPEMMLWRAHQLDFRVREVYAGYTAFQRFLSGVGDTDGPGPSPGPALRDKIDLSDLHLAGHSFGGATIVRLLQTAPPPQIAPLQAKRAVLLDPWPEPLARALPSTPASTPPPPTQSILSGEWANNGFFRSEVDTARSLGASLCTIVGLSHQGFSDFAMMDFRSRRGHHDLRTIHELTMARLRDTPFPFAGKADGGEPARVGDKLAGAPGDVVYHL